MRSCLNHLLLVSRCQALHMIAALSCMEHARHRAAPHHSRLPRSRCTCCPPPEPCVLLLLLTGRLRLRCPASTFVVCVCVGCSECAGRPRCGLQHERTTHQRAAARLCARPRHSPAGAAVNCCRHHSQVGSSVLALGSAVLVPRMISLLIRSVCFKLCGWKCVLAT